jgi:hypothetical protein
MSSLIASVYRLCPVICVPSTWICIRYDQAAGSWPNPCGRPLIRLEGHFNRFYFFQASAVYSFVGDDCKLSRCFAFAGAAFAWGASSDARVYFGAVWRSRCDLHYCSPCLLTVNDESLILSRCSYFNLPCFYAGAACRVLRISNRVRVSSELNFAPCSLHCFCPYLLYSIFIFYADV